MNYTQYGIEGGFFKDVLRKAQRTSLQAGGPLHGGRTKSGSDPNFKAEATSAQLWVSLKYTVNADGRCLEILGG